MIGRLQGMLVQKQPLQILIEIGGIGYEVWVPMSTFYQLPDINQNITLYIHQHIREDANLLYGFLSIEERNIFRQLIKINGIGAKIGLAILSSLSVQELSLAIATENVSCLCSVPGIGKKTAERLVLELREKLVLSTSSPTAHSAPSDHGCKLDTLNDIAGALVALGYSEKESIAMVNKLPPDIDVNTGIRLALKSSQRTT